MYLVNISSNVLLTLGRAFGHGQPEDGGRASSVAGTFQVWVRVSVPDYFLGS